MTTTDAWDRVQGDTNDTLTCQLDGVDTLPIGATLEAHVWRNTPPASSSTLVATVLDSTARTVSVRLGSWLTTASPGTWYVEVQVTAAWSDGQTGPRTFPSAGGRPLRIRAQGA